MLLFHLEFLEAYIDNVLQKIGKLKRVNIKYVSQGMIGIYVYNSCYFKDYVEATNIRGYLDRKTYGIWRSTYGGLNLANGQNFGLSDFLPKSRCFTFGHDCHAL